MNSLVKRILTAGITVPGVIALLFFSKRNNFPWAVGLFLACFAGIALFEFYNLIERVDVDVMPLANAILGAGGFCGYVWFHENFNLVIMGIVVGVAVVINLRRRELKENLRTIGGAILGLIYIPWLLHYFYLIYFAETGIIHSLNVLFIVWGYDTGAYFVGRWFGYHTIASHISPKKTAEGVMGGIAFAYVGASLSPIWVPYRMWIPHIVLIAILVGLATQFGDLVESLVKRKAGVKDAGEVFPGHGGVLDRIDGLLFALPMFYFYFHFILRFV